jgi:hypothetical protein
VLAGCGAGVVVPTSPQDSAALFPDLFGGEQAVKDARKAVKKS